MKLPKTLQPLLALLYLFASACTSLPVANKTAGERLESKILKRAQPLDFSALDVQEERSRGALALALLGKGLPIAVEGIKTLIRKDQEKYTASYQQVKSNLYFYDKPSAISSLDPQNIQFGGLELTRYITPKKTKQEEVALRMRFELADDPQSLYNLLNNSLFQLRLSELDLNYAKAKIPAARWYMPWTLIYANNDKLNLDIAITFYASWISEQGQIHNNEKLGLALLTLRDIPINNPQALENYQNKLRNTTLDGYFYLVPRSAGSYVSANKEIAKGFGQGVYSVDISVTESGREKFVNRIIFDNVDDALDKLPKALNLQ
ncbi:hypothetical protein [Cesiribacter andamanensis]|uniref:Lipoprotein n=1 Tax=Cesiribacter andamanensis AMV16 TaxID=1279009 RepID=M7N7L3_9BACT|nr:hypothetical protein [Cesiribacter andamanensis]EMR03221.1 hypothetical protein ADICEAN_01614 [Cesiribacter andamanensis AMV16]